MDVVHTGLERRRTAPVAAATEEAEAVDALWAHADPGDGLEHITARSCADRIDFLLFYLSRTPGRPSDAADRAHLLITAAHRASPLLRQRYLPLEPSTSAGHPGC
ncbi:hypothetical protein [Kitasatospora sp. NRRL B-11411]|uniref:hypothetical protein n=1 Tax=Kitasatospora sp. NRRL B-11411 TaxID=1463822 RepID=UPI0004C3E82F|nr:hypothetical protein [Kitasatospora sp. NRRL B-11411]